jgi:hypothetical protein
MTNGGRYSGDEVATLRAAFAENGFAGALLALPHRRKDSVQRQLVRLGLREPEVRPWTMHEIAELRRLYPTMTSKELGLRFGRSRSAIDGKLLALGLSGKAAPRWTPGQERIVEREVEALVGRLSERLGRTPRAVSSKIIRVVFEARKRSRRHRIVDLGGMTEYGIARPDRAPRSRAS